MGGRGGAPPLYFLMFSFDFLIFPYEHVRKSRQINKKLCICLNLNLGLSSLSAPLKGPVYALTVLRTLQASWISSCQNRKGVGTCKPHDTGPNKKTQQMGRNVYQLPCALLTRFKGLNSLQYVSNRPPINMLMSNILEGL